MWSLSPHECWWQPRFPWLPRATLVTLWNDFCCTSFFMGTNLRLAGAANSVGALAGTALASLALAAACASTQASAPSGSAPPSTAGTQRLTVRATDALRFEPSSLAVRAGQPVELTLRNDGQLAHDFTLAEGATGPVQALTAGQQAATATFTEARPGSYRFVCSQPGHAEAGQVGVIVAE